MGLRLDPRAGRQGVGRRSAAGHVVHLPAAQVHRKAIGVVELDVLVVGVPQDAVAVPVGFRVGHELVQAEAGGIDGRGGRVGGGRGRRWLVRPAGRGRVGHRPLAAAVHRLAVADVSRRGRIKVALDLRAVRPHQPHPVAAAVVEGDVRVPAPQNQVGLRLDPRAGRQGVGRRSAAGHVVHLPAAQVHRKAIGVVDLDVLVVAVAHDAVAVPVGLGVGHEFVEDDAGRVALRGRGRDGDAAHGPRPSDEQQQAAGQ